MEQERTSRLTSALAALGQAARHFKAAHRCRQPLHADYCANFCLLWLLIMLATTAHVMGFHHAAQEAWQAGCLLMESFNPHVVYLIFAF